MSEEYDDLFKQLTRFRNEVISLISERDAEVAALYEAVINGKPVPPDRVQFLRDSVRRGGKTFEQYNGSQLSAFQKYRE